MKLHFVLNDCLQPQQKQLLRTKNVEGESMNVQCSKESSIIQTPAGTNGDSRIYSNNNAASTTTTASSPILKRDGHTNGGDADTVIQRQTSWPTAVTTDQQDGENDIEGKSFYKNNLVKISCKYIY